MDRKFFWSLVVLIIVFAGVLVLGKVYFMRQAGYPGGQIPPGVACTAEAMLCPDGSYVGRSGPNCQFVCPDTNWKTYTNAEFGITFRYPATWKISSDVLSTAHPYIFFGNPLTGKATYALKFSVEDNPQKLSAESFVKQMLADDEAQDASNTLNGPAPRITPQFARQYAVNANGQSGYELYNVFEFDHNAEQIYVQQNKKMVVFDFPTGDANPNIASSSENNATTHEIVGTLTLDPAIWKFCGGIAAFQCAKSYTCKMDGTYPDAGGHCVAAGAVNK